MTVEPIRAPIVQGMIDIDGRVPACCRVDDVGVQKPEAAPRTFTDTFPHLIEIAHVPGREIIEPHDTLTMLQKRLDDIAADEASCAGHKP